MMQPQKEWKASPSWLWKVTNLGIWNPNNNDYIRVAHGPTMSAALSLVAT
jgi:hypothetical protein